MVNNNIGKLSQIVERVNKAYDNINFGPMLDSKIRDLNSVQFSKNGGKDTHPEDYFIFSISKWGQAEDKKVGK